MGSETDAKRLQRTEGEDGGQKRPRAPAKPPASPVDRARVDCGCEPEDLLNARIVELVSVLRGVSPPSPPA